jgi:phospholipid/cholesterol/gamma-HCH transport system substrate-binding protein
MERKATIKVGVLTVVSLSLLIFALIWLRGRGLHTGPTYSVYFQDVNGMKEGASVQLMGIRVGFVEDIAPWRDKRTGKYYVKVTFNLNQPDIHVPRGSLLSIEQSGFIGEQYIEITPPPLREVTLALDTPTEQALEPNMDVKFLYEEGFLTVGRVERVEKMVTKTNGKQQYRLYYRITRPGAVLFEDPVFEIVLSRQGDPYLRIAPRIPIVAQAPDKNLMFTIENPMRMKRFLEIQIESAEALKLTNEKISQLLSDETIATLNSTLRNTEQLTAKASVVLDSANTLFNSTQQDMRTLVNASEALTANIDSLTNNVNEIIGDPRLKRDILSAVASIRESSETLNSVINDPALKETFALTKDTAQDASEVMSLLKTTIRDKDVPGRIDQSITSLNTSLDRLGNVLTNVETLTSDDQNMKGVLVDLKETTSNLKQFSERLKGRFLLFRLLF